MITGSAILAALFSLIDRFGLAAVVAAIFLEYACFPLPSEILLPFAGAYASYKGVPFWALLALSAAAGLAGCSLCYAVGYFGGRPLLAAARRRFPRAAGGIDASQEWLDRYGSFSVMVGRVLPLCRTYISFIAGASRQPFARFAGFSLVGIAVWNSVLAGCGYFLGSHWQTIAAFAKEYTSVLLPFVLVALFAVGCSIRRRRKKGTKQ